MPFRNNFPTIRSFRGKNSDLLQSRRTHPEFVSKLIECSLDALLTVDNANVDVDGVDRLVAGVGEKAEDKTVAGCCFQSVADDTQVDRVKYFSFISER